jgi:regulator of protease activity HflC (stomatin/prohibitin superfamily)
VGRHLGSSLRVDLDTEDINLETLPRFQRASLYAQRWLTLAAWLGGLALGMLLVALYVPATIWRPLLCNCGAALLLLAAGLQSAWWVAYWRCAALHVPAIAWPPWLWQRLPGDHGETELPEASQGMVDDRGAWVWLCGLSLLALLAIMGGWDLSLTGVALGQAGYLTGGTMLLVAFGLLVLERSCASMTEAECPEAAGIARLVRVVIVTLLLAAFGLLFSAESNDWPARLAVLVGLLPALVALELMLRAVLSVFSPYRARLEPRLLADSVVAGLVRWHPHPLRTLQDDVQNRFGIDLRQVWAFAFMRRAVLPVLALIGFVGWLLSGLCEIPIDGRGIYERLGKPVAVLGPGLHAGLPWPLGRVVPVENGVVHTLAIALSSDRASVPEVSPAEGPAPASANRLWDASHVSEKSQLIASGQDGKQSFQVLNMDVRFVYRIALTDEAALAATYHSVDVPTLIRSTANRVLVHDFASRTLDGVLGEQRAVLAREIGNTVQAELTRLASGVEILATMIEAIHPPAGAANAYHAVQAAQITVKALSARERGRAADQTNMAQIQASMVRDQATAAAREARAGAEAAGRRFAAERQAYHRAGPAFLLEQYFSRLGQGLANARAVILDHRLGGGNAPTIDLRNYAPPLDSVAPSKAGQ